MYPRGGMGCFSDNSDILSDVQQLCRKSLGKAQNQKTP